MSIALTYADGYFPFPVRTLAEDGEPFQAWDGSTLYESSGTAWSGIFLPSKSSSEQITVYGDGSLYCVPLTLEQASELVWRVSSAQLTVPGDCSYSAQISVGPVDPGDGSDYTAGPISGSWMPQVTSGGITNGVNELTATEDSSELNLILPARAFFQAGPFDYSYTDPLGIVSIGYNGTAPTLVPTANSLIRSPDGNFWFDPFCPGDNASLNGGGGFQVEQDVGTGDLGHGSFVEYDLTYSGAGGWVAGYRGDAAEAGTNPSSGAIASMPVSYVLFSGTITANRYAYKSYYFWKAPDFPLESAVTPDSFDWPILTVTATSWFSYGGTYDTTTGDFSSS